MNFDLSDLRAFVAVADLASFRAAAEALHLSQPALSRRVDKLEQALGFRLLERSTRKVELNAMGRAFLPRARHVLAELEGALLGMADLAERIHGLVTVACIPSAVDNFVARAARGFQQRFPRIRLRVLDQPAPEILMSVARSEADFGISYLGTQEPDLDFDLLVDEPFVLACRRDHPLAQRAEVAWAELAAHDCIALAPGSGNRLLIEQGLAGSGARPRWHCEAQHVPAVLSLVEAGVGVGAVPQLALAAGTSLAGVPLVAPRIARSVGVVRRRGRPLSPAAQAFLDNLNEISLQRLPVKRKQLRKK
ncbi:LysR family transcriptional regulator [Acidovorax sp. SDU_ACID1]|uniref:LysR family transcriptional regulator n=1 Tax=Acidovorax sp. SDU_ACID1 TaxID=3136632 RepID=UPI0038733FCB